MTILLFIAIAVLGLASYGVGIWQMVKGRYFPNTFSRVIWVLLAINSFAGVVLSNGSKSSILLGAVLLLGNIAMCVASFWRGTKDMGRLEYFSLFLLLVSALIWIFFHAPLINLSISLFAHFVGGLPIYKKIWLDPKSESVGFWSLFFFASLLSVFVSSFDSWKAIILPMYFTIFDGSMSLLTLRKKSFSGVDKGLSLVKSKVV